MGPVSPVIGEGMVYYGGGSSLCAVDLTSMKEKWCHEAGGIIFSTPAVTQGYVLFAAWPGAGFYALDAQDGGLKWQMPRSGSVGLCPTVAENVVYFANEVDNKLYALELQSGTVLWSFRTKGMLSPPVPGEGVVYFSAKDNSLYAVH